MANQQLQLTAAELTTLGARIRELREKHRPDDNAATIAEQMGVSRSSMSHWESGTNAPSLAALLRLADAIGCAPADFLAPFAPKSKPAPRRKQSS